MNNAMWLYHGMENLKSTCRSTVSPKELVDLNHIFGAFFRASLGQTRDEVCDGVEFVLQSKSCEIMAAFKEIQLGASQRPSLEGDMNRMVSGGLYFLLGVITANIDLAKVASHIQPCGDPTCGCHNAQLMVVRCLQMIRDGMEAHHNHIAEDMEQ